MTTEEKAQAYDEALERARKQKYDYQKEFDKTDKSSQLAEILRAGICAIELAFPELAESEDEKIRRFLKDYAIEMIAGLESDISISVYDGVKGHDPDAEAELEKWRGARAWLEKQKEKSEKPIITESEDERIRKGLIELIENWNYPQELFTTKRNIVAYLEKQKEPIDPFDTKLFQDGVKEGRRLEREESEDEKIRKALVIMMKVPRKEIFEAQGITKE